jgi:hypothetical protein
LAERVRIYGRKTTDALDATESKLNAASREHENRHNSVDFARGELKTVGLDARSPDPSIPGEKNPFSKMQTIGND